MIPARISVSNMANNIYHLARLSQDKMSHMSITRLHGYLLYIILVIGGELMVGGKDFESIGRKLGVP